MKRKTHLSLSHFLAFLSDNVSLNREQACLNDCMNKKMTMNDDITGIVAETVVLAPAPRSNRATIILANAKIYLSNDTGPHAAWFHDPTMGGGGCVLDMAVHSLAFLRNIAGAEALRIYAELDTFVHEPPAEDTAVLTVRFANGVIGLAEDSWSTVGEMDSRFEVYGTKGRILVDMLHSQHLRVYSQAGYTYWGSRSDASKGWTYPLPLDEHIVFGTDAMFDHFFRCLLEGEPCRSTGEDGRAILSLAEAAYRSARSGCAEQPLDRREPEGELE